MRASQRLGAVGNQNMRTALRNILRTLDVLAVELRAVIRRTWKVDEPCAVRPPAMVRQLESRVLLMHPRRLRSQTVQPPTHQPLRPTVICSPRLDSDDLARSSTASPAADSASDSQAAVRRELLFVDSGVADCRQLVDGLAQRRYESGRGGPGRQAGRRRADLAVLAAVHRPGRRAFRHARHRRRGQAGQHLAGRRQPGRLRGPHRRLGQLAGDRCGPACSTAATWPPPRTARRCWNRWPR